MLNKAAIRLTCSRSSRVATFSTLASTCMPPKPWLASCLAILAFDPASLGGRFQSRVRVHSAPSSRSLLHRVTPVVLHWLFRRRTKPAALTFNGLPKGEIYQIAINAADATFASYGELWMTYDGNIPIVQLNVAMPPGCRNVAPDLATRKYRLQYKADWHGIRLVSAKRAYFHNDAHESTRQRAYVVKWMPSRCSARRLRLRACNTSTTKVATTGWLKQEDVAPPGFFARVDHVRTKVATDAGQMAAKNPARGSSRTSRSRAMRTFWRRRGYRRSTPEVSRRCC